MSPAPQPADKGKASMAAHGWARVPVGVEAEAAGLADTGA
jgi:hypothetical protein